MFQKLKEKYPNARIQKAMPGKEHNHYHWYTVSGEPHYIGIPKEVLSIEEKDLLAVFLEPITPSSFISYTPEETQWYRFLFDEDTTLLPAKQGETYRFIHFHISSYVDRELLVEAFSNIFPSEIIVLFHEKGYGLIIEKKSDFMMSIEDLSAAVQVLESDFLTMLSFFFGKSHHLTEGLSEEMMKEKSLFSFALSTMHKNKVITFEEVFPVYLLKQLSNSQKETVFSSLHQGFKEEPEMVLTIKRFLENQSNVSLTAKQLFMHRNSLQYRIDKFIEKTQINLKSFKGGITAYLACLDYEFHHQSSNMHKDD
ncbi:helix-turn-helix domain-containing protein [Bacillus spongiae]|uniref:Helix-turn-helix domain-containing protein n=1 Tax=Bacillus spongiae TaxID=2683610 RepID=A0ABU8HAS5_9BACI